MAKNIWKWCIARNIWLTATHIPGVQNVVADHCSRKFHDSSEWKLAKWAFEMCTQQWGTPDIDMFASHLNNQLPSFASWKPDPSCTYIDAFTLSWQNSFIYCFPPFALICRTLNKVITDKAKAIVVAPRWPAQPWFPLLANLALDKPITFPQRQNLLHLPSNPGLTHPILTRLHLQAWLISG